MCYAINSTGTGWRAIESEEDLLPGETISLTQPVLVVTPTPQEALASLDTTYALSQRNLREFIMLTAEALKSGTPIDVTVLPGVQTVYAVEAQAVILRAQL
jgi:hypothetical protein